MKKWNVICILTVLVIGMGYMSGCTSPVSTSMAPVAPTPQHIVYETVPVSPAPTPAPAIPTSTVPAVPTLPHIVYGTVPGTPVQTPATAIPTSTVLAVPTPRHIVYGTVPGTPIRKPAAAVPTANETGYNESTFKDNNRNTPLFVENEPTGGLFINIRAGGSVDGLKVFIAREGTNVSPIEYSFLPDRTVVEGENKGYLQVKILPDGRSELIKLLPGNYTAYLPNWNGGEPEQQSFMIREEDITPIWFAGFAASSGGGCGC